MKCTFPTLGGWKTFSEPTYPKELEKEGPHQYLNPGFWTSQQKGGPRLCPGLLPCSRSPLVLGLPANFSLSLFLGLPCTWPKKSALLLIVFLIGFVNLASQFLFFFFFFFFFFCCTSWLACDFSSPTRDRTCTPCSGSTES